MNRVKLIAALSAAAVFFVSCGSPSESPEGDEGILDGSSGSSVTPGESADAASAVDSQVATQTADVPDPSAVAPWRAQCSLDVSAGTVMPLTSWLNVAQDWARVDPDVIRLSPGASDAGGDYTLRVSIEGPADSLRGDVVSDVALRASLADAIQGEIARGTDSFYFGVNVEGEGRVIAANGDDVYFLGNCTGVIYDEMVRRAVIGSSYSSGREIVEGLLVGDAAAEKALEAPAPPDWYSLSPDARTLDPFDTPSEVLDRLRVVTIQFEVPDSWAVAGWSVCTEDLEGLNECGLTTLKPEIELLAYTTPGTDLTVSVVNDDGDRRPIGFIAANDIADYDGEGVILVNLSGETPDAAVSAAAAGSNTAEVLGN